ncbi:MAG: PmoA family protein [Lentisphaerales bacterium]|nr:PmoA family protein [Lentisphaerales bacterium]
MNKLILILSTFLMTVSCVAQQSAVKMQKKGNNVLVFLNGELFTEYVSGEQKPYLYPVIGPTGVSMTRNYPMKDTVKEERKDHPWHSSIYFTHGAVNGKDFWNDKSSEHKACRIVLDEIKTVDNISSDKGRIIASHKWVNGKEVYMTDTTEIHFSGDADKRIIDYKVTLHASNGDVKLGDTKEGCMAVRMHYKLRVKDMKATVINSEGLTGKKVWGQKAKWISYSNEIEGAELGITMMDNPANFRYPTPWHARDYGLCAANAFGLKYFTKDKKNVGDITLKSGEDLSFSYRLVFHKGSPKTAKVEELFNSWTTK